jgi:hypothetical protein
MKLREEKRKRRREVVKTVVPEELFQARDCRDSSHGTFRDCFVEK